MGMNDRQYKARKEPEREPAFRFIDYSLLKSDESWLDEADLDTEFPISLIDELIDEGYKVSESLDRRNNSYIFAVTDRVKGSPTHNACLTGRGATRIDAWHAFAYRHYVASNQDWNMLERRSEDQPPPRYG